MLEKLQDLLLFALAEPLPFVSSQNFHLNETNLEMVSVVCPVPVLAVGAPHSATGKSIPAARAVETGRHKSLLPDPQLHWDMLMARKSGD